MPQSGTMPLADPNRLAALRRFGLLDTPPDPAFDRLTRLAASVLHTPVALIALVEADQQFFKSCFGLGEPWASARQTPLSHSFCQYVVITGAPLVISDARIHPLVHTSPAIHDLGVVAYLGIPLTTSDKYTLGALCVIDHVPRMWNDGDVVMLQDLTAFVMTEIERREDRSQRHQAEVVLREARDPPEQRVIERTDVQTPNQRLLHELIERARVEEQLRQRNEELIALHEMANGLINRLDRESLLEGIVTRAAALIGTTHGYLYVVEPDGLYLRVQIAIGIFAPNVGYRLKRNEGLAGRIWETGEAQAVDDYGQWPERMVNLDYMELRAVVGVPLWAGSDLTGVLGLAHIEQQRTFRASEIILLNRFAHLASLALENARLYHVAQQELDQRRRVEVALRESEEQYRTLLELAPAPIAVHRDGRLVYVNAASARLLGAAEPDELIGQPVAQFVHPDYREVALARAHHLQHTRTPVAMMEEQFVRLDGEVVDVEVVGIPIIYNGQAAVQVVVRDITERKRAEADRLALEHSLLEAQKRESLGVLAGGIAHDFNNILAAILGNAELVLLDLPPAAEARALIEPIIESTKRAADLTHQMLAYVGKGHFVVTLIDLNLLVRNTMTMLRTSITKTATLHYDLNSTLPLVEGDAVHLRQVIMHVIVNASEAIGDQQGTITLRTGVVDAVDVDLSDARFAPPSVEGEYVYLEVDDTGVGMDDDTQARMFEPFFSTKFTGRGLGLAAVMGIMQRHGGIVKLRSTPGVGTTFTIFLQSVTAFG